MNNEKARKERLRSYGMGRWPLWFLDACTVGSDGILWQFTTQTTHNWLLADVPLFPTETVAIASHLPAQIGGAPIATCPNLEVAFITAADGLAQECQPYF